MKKIVFVLILVLMLLPSCYFNEMTHYVLEISDNGTYIDDKTKHVVSISAPEGFADIRYTLDGTAPTQETMRYYGTEYICTDTKTYSGILVDEGDTLKAVAYKGSEVTFNAEISINVKTWEINIVNDGCLEGDTLKYIVTITDSLRSGDIYYTTDGTEPTVDSERYTPSIYVGPDSREYSGILIDKGDTVKAVSFAKVKDVIRSSTVSILETGIKIGDTGPAGGIIFYDKGEYSDGWRYLEAAPDKLEGTYNYDRAISACASAVINGYDDWFLPEKNQLNSMYLNLKVRGKGNFDSEKYWTSTMYSSDLAWYQNFYNGTQGYYNRSYYFYVRPVRVL